MALMLAVIGNFEGNAIRTVENCLTRAGTTADLGWVLADVCVPLAMAGPENWARVLDDDEKGLCNSQTLGGPQELVFVTEPGLYKLLARSRKPEAKRFDRWVRHEVLPTIRKTGGYGVTHQHSDDLCTLIGDAVGHAIRPIIAPIQAQLDLLTAKVDRPAWADVCEEFGLTPLDSWLHVTTIQLPPSLPGLYRIQYQGERTLYIGQAKGKKGLYGRLNGTHECLQYLQHTRQSYRITVCPTAFAGRKLDTAEKALCSALKAEWEYGDRLGEWRKYQALLAQSHHEYQGSLF